MNCYYLYTNIWVWITSFVVWENVQLCSFAELMGGFFIEGQLKIWRSSCWDLNESLFEETLHNYSKSAIIIKILTLIEKILENAKFCRLFSFLPPPPDLA